MANEEHEDVANWLASAKAMIVDLLEEVLGLERVYSVTNEVSANYLSFRLLSLWNSSLVLPKKKHIFGFKNC